MTSRAVLVPLHITFTLAVASCLGDPPSSDVCDAGGAPIVHEGRTITSVERWSAGTHVVRGTIQIRDGGSLTIAACATVQLAPDVSIEVGRGSGGTLIAAGTERQPVVFEREDPDRAWGRLFVTTPGQLSLSFTLLDGGGGPTSELADAEYGGASLVARGDSSTLPALVTASHVTITRSTGLGVMMLDATFEPSSRRLAVGLAGAYPLYIGVRAAGSIPAESLLVGNGIDAILLQSVGVAAYDMSEPILGDVTLRYWIVPYRVGHTEGSIVVGDEREESPDASLTLEAGVTLAFNRQTSHTNGLVVNGAYRGGHYEPQGALIIEGTASLPVTLTSAEVPPAPGDWMGIYFSHALDPRTRIEHAEIHFAGGDSGAVGACPASPGATSGDADCSVIFFLDEDASPRACITSSLFVDGLGCGIYRGWRDDDIDLRATNVFESLTGCDQSGVRLSGGCSPCE